MTRPPLTAPAFSTPHLVTPPYVTFDALEAAPPLGSFCLVDLDDGAGAVEALVTLVLGAPWVPSVVVQRGGTASSAVLNALQGLPGLPAFVLKRPDEGLPLTVLGQDALRCRPPVDADRAAAWVAARIGRPNLVNSLTVAMTLPHRQGWLTRLSPSGRWLARKLGTISSLASGDWREVFILATAAGNVRMSPSYAADLLHLDVWTMRRRLDKLAGVTPDQYRTLAGWEWFLEAVLRRHCGVRPPS